MIWPVEVVRSERKVLAVCIYIYVRVCVCEALERPSTQFLLRSFFPARNQLHPSQHPPSHPRPICPYIPPSKWILQQLSLTLANTHPQTLPLHKTPRQTEEEEEEKKTGQTYPETS